MSEHDRAYFRELVDQKKGIMFQMEWYRIILDEAQYLPFSTKSNVKLYQKSFCSVICCRWQSEIASEMVFDR